jgi:hypothetical protein
MLLLSACEGNGYDFHNSPDYVKNGGKNHADEKENKRIVDDALHNGNAHIFFRACNVLIHNFVSAWLMERSGIQIGIIMIASNNSTRIDADQIPVLRRKNEYRIFCPASGISPGKSIS